jgi:hypothetical protein
MRRFGTVAIAAGVLAASACQHASKPDPQPAPSAGGSGVAKAPAVPTPTPPTVVTGGPPLSGTPGIPRTRRPPPDPKVMDSVRRANVADVEKTIAGHEKEPAGQVFKNVKLLDELSAGELLRTMNETYARGLGVVCSNCHTVGQFDLDKKNKRIARQMQQMTNAINEQLAKTKELDDDYNKVTCVTCHRGSNKPPNKMDVPVAAPAVSRPPGE